MIKSFLKILVLLLPVFSSEVFSKETYKVSLSSACPYYCVEGSKQGYVAELLTLFFKKHKTKVVFVNTPYSRIADSLRSGVSDLALLTSLDVRGTSEFIVYPPVLGVSSAGLVSKSGASPMIIDYVDLKDKSIFLAQGSKASEIIFTELSRINKKDSLLQLITGSRIHERLIDLVALGRADFAISDYNVLSYFHSINKNKEKVNLTPSSLSGYSPLRLVSNRSLPIQSIIEKDLSKFIETLRSKGKLAKLLEKYNISDWNLVLSR